MYVREGQENQYDILRNDSGSRLYQEFATGLGWLVRSLASLPAVVLVLLWHCRAFCCRASADASQVDLNTHAGFLGGLTAGVGGDTALFYADRNYEVIFHEVTRMPTVPKDPNQVEKVNRLLRPYIRIHCLVSHIT